MKKKSISSFISKIQETKEGKIIGGFVSIKGGFKLLGTNDGTCTNSNTCGSTNNTDCTNSGDCSKSTNKSTTVCSNTGTCPSSSGAYM